MHELIYTIRSELIKNKGNSANPVLYQRVHYGTKKLVMEYYQEVIKGLLYIATSKRLPLYKKIEFFTEARHSYGRTALMLSGGAANGVYHYGIIKTLYHHDLLPRIICGSSAGALVASFICTRSYEELASAFENEVDLLFDFVEHEVKGGNPLSQLQYFLKNGHFLKIEALFAQIRQKIGELTFQEAFDKYKWVLNITVCGQNQEDDSLMMNYLTAPNVLICSAATASCAVPSVFSAVVILCKNSKGEIVPYRQDGTRFVDGSVWQDLPLEKMSQLFNINTFIVSQVNPYVVPFLAYSDGGGVLGQGHRDNWLTTVRQLFYDETAHRIKQLERTGFVPAILKRIINIFIQNYRGTVTVSPHPRLLDYLFLLKNPTLRFIRYAVAHMSRCTYPSKLFIQIELALIRGVYGIERELDRFYQSLKA